MASLIWNWRSVIQIMRATNEGIASYGYDGDTSLLTLERAVFKQSWMATVALGINVRFQPCDATHHHIDILSGQVIIGDAVVWWRACVIWRHRAVYYAGPMLLLLTLGMRILIQGARAYFTLPQVSVLQGHCNLMYVSRRLSTSCSEMVVLRTLQLHCPSSRTSSRPS